MIFTYQQHKYLSEAFESDMLTEETDINTAIEDLMKYANLSKDKGDIDGILKAIQAFKQERIKSLISRSLSGDRALSSNVHNQLSQWLVGVILSNSFSFSDLANFFRRLQKRDFIKDLNFKPGTHHPITDLIPDDPIIKKIWKDAFSFTVREGIISGGRGEMLLTILGAGRVTGNNGGGGDILFPGNIGVEVKTITSSYIPRAAGIDGETWRTFPKGTAKWQRLSSKYLPDDAFKEQAALCRKVNYAFYTAVSKIMSDNGAPRDYIAEVFEDWNKQTYSNNMPFFSKSYFLSKMDSNGVIKDEREIHNDYMIKGIELYKNISGWKYMLIFSGTPSMPDGYYIIEKPSDILAGKNKEIFGVMNAPFIYGTTTKNTSYKPPIYNSKDKQPKEKSTRETNKSLDKAEKNWANRIEKEKKNMDPASFKTWHAKFLSKVDKKRQNLK
jgi:hypothetical protein